MSAAPPETPLVQPGLLGHMAGHWTDRLARAMIRRWSVRRSAPI